ncbi:hypothetical protein CDD80_5911 [Ophiocordyceps camponoti-rufipedis]|uniref:Uncharacterized protein n=1 Tax=Ophiocordyceps camponoti-rufipedis TaxID=2004952 RepID=A0A2C5ZGQ4_9HYPO|nr:hypothetical protein CDD80_5911 [Ophiocordyceps camponoti-rufipedis]
MHCSGRLPPAAAMATTPLPLPVRHSSSSSSSSPSPSFFQLPNKKRRQNRPVDHEDDGGEQAAVLQEEASLRTQALVYLDDFLHNSKWTDQLDQITIVQEAVPTMPELNSYGDLDEKEGTRVCRRLFKAVVVWDELGHHLWRTLRAASDQRRLVQQQFEATSGDMVHPAAFTSRRRPSRRSSGDSYDSAFSQLSLESAHESIVADGKRRLRLSPKKLSISSTSSSPESSLEPASTALERQASSDSNRHVHHDSIADQSQPLNATGKGGQASDAPLPPPPPKIHWPAAMKRTLGVFGEGRANLPIATSTRQRSNSHHSAHPRQGAPRPAVVAANFF